MLNIQDMDDKVHYERVKYMSGITIDEDGDKFPQYKSIKVAVSHIKIYDGTFDMMIKLNKCAKNLILYLAFNMDSKGIVRNDVHVKKGFNDKIKSLGLPAYSDTTLNIAFMELNKATLLLNRGKGSYKVNPIHIYKNSDSKRHQSIKEDEDYDKANKDKQKEVA